jgi:hypothetical protein
VFFQGVDGKVETVLATNRVESQYEPISGDITVHRPGTVILVRTRRACGEKGRGEGRRGAKGLNHSGL